MDQPMGAWNSGPTAHAPETREERIAALVQLLEQLHESGYRHVTPSPATHARVLRHRASAMAASIEDALGWNLPFDDDLLPARMFGSLLDAAALKSCAEGWRSRIRISSLGSRLFVHSAYPTDDQDAVFFGPDSYRFARFVTDHLGAAEGRDLRIADIGTGAGVGAVLAAGLHPEATVLATDINQRALDFAAANARAAGAAISFRRCKGLKEIEGALDVVMMNPPYMDDGPGRAYRDGGSHHGGQLSLDLARAAISRVVPGGTVLLYTGSAIVRGRDWLRDALGELAPVADISYQEIDPDVFGEELDKPAYADVDRIAVIGAVLKRRCD